jgi:hypothetical protein
LGVAPVVEGTGIRVKILKYLSAGLPVVATSAAAEGLDLPAICVEDNWGRFAERCIAILQSERPFQDQVEGAQCELRKSWSWSVVAMRAASVYDDILSRQPQDRSGFSSEAILPSEPRLPMWFDEVIRKGRFHDAGDIPAGCSYGIAGHGEVRWLDQIPSPQELTIHG